MWTDQPLLFGSQRLILNMAHRQLERIFHHYAEQVGRNGRQRLGEAVHQWSKLAITAISRAIQAIERTHYRFFGEDTRHYPTVAGQLSSSIPMGENTGVIF